MARASRRLVMRGSKDTENSMFLDFSDTVLVLPHQLRKGGYYKERKTFNAMIEELSRVKGVSIQGDSNMSGSSSAEVVDAGHGPLLRLLANIHQFVVVIDDLRFECSAYPFVLKSSYFKHSIQDFKTSTLKAAACTSESHKTEIPLPEIPLVLPGGRQTFELIRIFCYDSRVPITTQNVLNLLAASYSLGFTEDVALDNLHSRCQKFIQEESEKHGVQGILSMLATHNSTTDDDLTDCDLLITELAQRALAFQSTHDTNTLHIVDLLSGLRRLHPRVLDATLREFDRLGVTMVEFFWCSTEPSTNSDAQQLLLVLLGFHSFGPILSYFIQALDKCIAAGEVQIDRLDPKKLVTLLTSTHAGVGFRRPMQSEDAIWNHVATNLSDCVLEDLHPRAVRDLVSRAVLASISIQCLAGLVDRVLVVEAGRRPWDGSVECKERFQAMAECVPLSVRESHDLLYDAVERFSGQRGVELAEDIWSMVDVEKLSEAKFEAAVSFTMRHDRECSRYYVRLLRRLHHSHLSLKRQLSVLEEDYESGRIKSRRMSLPDYCGSTRTLFTVFVRSLDGRLSSVVVESGTTVTVIREVIAKTQSAIHSGRFWWPVYRGRKLLQPHMTLHSYGVRKDCTLYIKVVLVDEPEREFLGSSRPATDEFFASKSPCVCGCK